MKAKRVSAAVGVCVIALGCIVAAASWIPALPCLLIADDKLEKSELIIVPSGNAQALRLDHAIRLYKEGFAPRVLLCGEIALAKETGLNLAKLYVTSRGVPEDAVITEQDSQSTFENALFTRPLIEQQRLNSVILVTYPLHTRRTKLIFSEVYPKQTKIIASCDRSGFDPAGWWRDRNRARNVAYECFALLWHYLLRT